MRRSLERARSELAERLRARRGEIEEALLTRTYAIADPAEAADPEYAQGLRAAVSAALDFGLEAVERGEERSPQIPVLLLAQARLAARNNVPLDTVLRRYFAGYSLLGDFLMEEAQSELAPAEMKRLMQTQSALCDQLLAAVSKEYEAEGKKHHRSPEQRRAEQVRRLLRGESQDASRLAYEIEGMHHIGVVAIGAGAEEALHELQGELDRSLLVVNPGEEMLWAWLGGRRAVPAERILERLKTQGAQPLAAAAIGECGEGLQGWRLSHRQAATAFALARRGPEPVVRYAEVGLIASILKDEILCASLRQLYLEPLARGSDGGKALRETLRAYLNTGRNFSSAAARLKVNRRTIASRLRIIEEMLGHRLDQDTLELEAALRLWEQDAYTQHPIGVGSR
jgi:DNA-binding PucR family transcriptional regulator